MDFITWMAEMDSTNMQLWMIMGDFNLIKGPKNRSRAGGDINNMMNFNAIIQARDLEEIPLKGRAFTWSNMQDSPLLERLDWVFTSPDWTTEYPNTLSYPLARLGSDHVPIHIQIGNNIPKSTIFRFENHWLDFDGFYDTVKLAWDSAPIMQDIAKMINAKFKSARYSLKKWSKKVSNLKEIISDCQYTLSLLDGIEELRSLSIIEKNFKNIVENHTIKMLEAKRIYWKSRAKIKWSKLGDENTKLFHIVATQQYRRNIITSLKASDGTDIYNHDNKASIICSSFKERLGISEESPISWILAALFSHMNYLIWTLHLVRRKLLLLSRKCPLIKHLVQTVSMGNSSKNAGILSKRTSGN
jgi:hypothetical protein